MTHLNKDINFVVQGKQPKLYVYASVPIKKGNNGHDHLQMPLHTPICHDL